MVMPYKGSTNFYMNNNLSTIEIKQVWFDKKCRFNNIENNAVKYIYMMSLNLLQSIPNYKRNPWRILLLRLLVALLVGSYSTLPEYVE